MMMIWLHRVKPASELVLTQSGQDGSCHPRSLFSILSGDRRFARIVPLHSPLAVDRRPSTSPLDPVLVIMYRQATAVPWY